LSSDSESKSAKKQDSDVKDEIYAAGEGSATWEEQVIIPNLKTLWKKFRGETNTYRLC
jgi:hypothetical protein